MKTFLHLAVFFCLVILGQMKAGQCLVCHSCNKFSSVTECDLQPPENCTAEKPLCKITQEKTGIPGVEMFSKVTTTKGCASVAECNGEDVSAWESKKYIWCCQNDLCNIFQNMGKAGMDLFNSHAPKSDPLPVLYAAALVLYIIYCA